MPTSMTPPTPVAGQKRKAAIRGPASNAASRKRQKGLDARNIATQTADKALSMNGELNIASFIQSREHAINALDRSMRKSRQGLMSRAFQEVPRHLRRRTASHNAKKVPRRLRKRAEREMIEDNTPTTSSRKPSSRLKLRLQTAKALKKLNALQKSVRQKKKEAKINAQKSDPAQHVSVSRVPRIKKNTLAEPPRAIDKYKRRQVKKTWLPTHLWHAKRARMTRPVEPLWRIAIPLTPSEKSYRPTHRAANSRGAVAWDTSFIATVGCLGTESALEGLLKALGFNNVAWSGTKYNQWKSGNRFAMSWVSKRDAKDEIIAPITVVWAPRVEERHSDKVDLGLTKPSEEAQGQEIRETRSRKKLDRRLIIRVHPSSFHELWLELLRVAKSQKPQVLVEDLRFELGSIELRGSGSTEALLGVLQPVDSNEPISTLWSSLKGLTNPASLPANALMSFNVKDPRLNHPPKQVQIPQDEQSRFALIQTLTEWPVPPTPVASPLFSHKSRHIANRLPSQKAIQRWKMASAKNITVRDKVDTTKIPVMLLAQRSKQSQANSQGSWLVLAPWKCIDVIWRSLMYYPLSSGGTPRFGGLQEQQQIAFEQTIPWFPGDSPGTESGKAWERTVSENRFDEWIRKPPSRRLAYRAIDLGLGRRGELGRGWNCDWDFLLQDTVKDKKVTKDKHREIITQVTPPDTTPLTQRQRKHAKAKVAAEQEVTSRRRNTSSPESDADGMSDSPSPDYVQLEGRKAQAILADPANSTLPVKPSLVSIRIRLLTKGTPNVTARIYRLPAATTAMGEQCVKRTAIAPDMADKTSAPSTSPPAAQASRHVDRHSKFMKDRSIDLRSRWLGIYETANIANKTTSNKPMAKEKTNRHGLPVKHYMYPPANLDHINVLPRNAPQEVIEQYGRKPPTALEIQAQLDADLQVQLEEQAVWDTHVPCPDVEDLIGFVTSGGYNLSEGRGTAIGSIWLQRVVEGWLKEDKERDIVDTNAKGDGVDDGRRNGGSSGKTKSNASAIDKKMAARQRRMDGERHLCIVRNSGESIGRLATWEVCE